MNLFPTFPVISKNLRFVVTQIYLISLSIESTISLAGDKNSTTNMGMMNHLIAWPPFFQQSRPNFLAPPAFTSNIVLVLLSFILKKLILKNNDNFFLCTFTVLCYW